MNRLRSRAVWRITTTLTLTASALAYNGCSGEDASSANGSANGTDSGGDAIATGDDGDANANDGAITPTPEGGLPFTCAETTAKTTSKPCPAVSGTAGHVDFCFRPQWSGVTAVDVYLSANGQPSDWTSPFMSLTNDGSGTFTGSSALANGTYPYAFRVTGSADGLVKDGQYLLDQENPSFVKSPTGAPGAGQRSISQVTVPQPPAAALYHVKGKVLFAGAPQACYSIDLEAGEGATGEHTTANLAESAADGTFDFPVATGSFMAVVRYPFKLAAPDGGYPDPSVVPSVGVIRAGLQVVSSDVTLDPANVAYPDYAKMSPTGGTATLPVTFTFSLTPGAETTQASVTMTNVAGNDPSFASGFATDTTVSWDGGFNGEGGVKTGTTYYWGAWQRTEPLEDGGTEWTAESLLFPITFH